MSRVNYSGFVVAGIGFFLTRFTVTLAIYQDPMRFYLAGVVPLVLGLGLAAFGVALAVADLPASLVRTTALWCVLGVGTMLILVVLTLLGSTPGRMTDVATLRSQVYLSNFLIGGAVGGTLTGLYAFRNRRQRSELRNQTHRLDLLNRWLRHEILNALTAIRGYAGLGPDENAQRVIESQTASIEQTIQEVKYLTQRANHSAPPVSVSELEAYLRDAAETVRETNPEADISVTVDTADAEATVLATDRLTHVFVQLIENAAVYSTDDAPAVEARLVATGTHVRMSVSDTGPGLPESQQRLLESGAHDGLDRPESGYGLNIVRLLIESFDARIDTEVDDDGTTITVVFPRADAESTGIRSDPTGIASVRPSAPQLVVALGASLVAGVFYGLASELLGGSIAGIGVFYGASDPIVGWLTHQFHSVVFGFAFAGLVSFAPGRRRNPFLIPVVVGVAWGLTLWTVAAGIIAPLWLQLLGISASIPNLTFVLFVSHLAWGVSLGALTAWGRSTLSPWITQLWSRFR
jgi:two-component system OmpR family sensor kinase